MWGHSGSKLGEDDLLFDFITIIAPFIPPSGRFSSRDAAG